MAKTRQQKEAAVQALTGELKKAKSAVLANFQGLSVKDTDELRAKCRAAGLKYVVGKKTLITRALSAAGYEFNAKAVSGGISILSGGDEVGPAKTIAEFGKTHEAVKIFGGLLDGVLVDAAKIMQLSALPGKQELLARLAGSLNSPISGLVNVMAGNLRGLVNVLNAVKDKKPA